MRKCVDNGEFEMCLRHDIESLEGLYICVVHYVSALTSRVLEREDDVCSSIAFHRTIVTRFAARVIPV